MKVGKIQTTPFPARSQLQRDRTELRQRLSELAIDEWIPVELDKGDGDHRFRVWIDWWNLKNQKKMKVRKLVDRNYAILRTA